jgi:hypothetical protein
LEFLFKIQQKPVTVRFPFSERRQNFGGCRQAFAYNWRRFLYIFYGSLYYALAKSNLNDSRKDNGGISMRNYMHNADGSSLFGASQSSIRILRFIFAIFIILPSNAGSILQPLGI